MCKAFFGDGTLSLQAHHIIPRKKGGRNINGNLITLCGYCHDIAEEQELSKLEILSYLKESVPVEKPISKIMDWHKWVYGGYKNPWKS